MKRAVFMLMMSWLTLSAGLVLAQSPAQKSESKTASQNGAAAPKDKTGGHPASGKASASGAPLAPGTTPSRSENPNSRPSEPPRVKIVEITRLDDLHVRVRVEINEAAQKNAVNFQGLAGSLSVNAEFDNGQVANAAASLASDTRLVTVELRPVTVNPNGNAGFNPSVLEDKTGGKGGNNGNASAPGDKEQSVGIGVRSTRGLVTAPRLTKVTVKLSFSLKGGNQNNVITDELTRKF